MNSMLMRAPVTADFADALADRLQIDQQLAVALVLQEAWSTGYVDRVLSAAEVLSAQFAELSYVGVDGLSPTTLDRARSAVDRTIARMNPASALDADVERPTGDEVEVLIDMVRAFARFQRLSAHLERRSPRRLSSFLG